MIEPPPPRTTSWAGGFPSEPRADGADLVRAQHTPLPVPVALAIAARLVAALATTGSVVIALHHGPAPVVGLGFPRVAFAHALTFTASAGIVVDLASRIPAT